MTDLIYHANDDNYDNVVVASEKPVIIDYWAEWCPPCKRMGPIFEEIADQVPEVTFVKVNIDDVRDAALKGMQAVKSSMIPTFVLYRNGEVVAHSIGVMSASELKSFINKGLAGTLEPEVESLLDPVDLSPEIPE